MPKNIVVALKIPNVFGEKPFATQLKDLEEHIRKVCQFLNTPENADKKWIIAWQEYGLTDGADNPYLSSAQKDEFKKVMQAITKDFKQLTIIGGTVSSSRPIPLRQKRRAANKISEIREAYRSNAYFNMDDKFRQHRVESEQRMRKNFDLIRNTCYVFANDACIARHDKVTPYGETKFLSTGVYRPGYEDSLSNIVQPEVGVEICLEHALGVMAKALPKELYPLLQIIVSASTTIQSSNCVSPYVIHVDSRQPVRLITDVAEKDAEVALYSYEIYSDEKTLTPVPGQTKRAYAFESLREALAVNTKPGDISSIVLDCNDRSLLTADDYISLLGLAAAKYIRNTLLSRTEPKKESYIQCIDNTKEFLGGLLDYVALYIPISESRLLEDLLLMVVANKDTVLLEKLLGNYHHVLKNALLCEPVVTFVIKHDLGQLFEFIVEERLKSSVNQAVTANGDTALHLAVKYNAVNVTRMLLQQGYDISLTNKDGKTALDVGNEFLRLNQSTLMILQDIGEKARREKAPVGGKDRFYSAREEAVCNHLVQAALSPA